LVDQAGELARVAPAPADFLVMDACGLGFRDQSFDAVLLIGSVVSYVRSRRRRCLAFQDIRRMLRPGGKLFVETPAREYSWKLRAWFMGMAAAHLTLRLVGRAGREWELGDRVGPAWRGDTSRLVYLYMYSPGELAADLTGSGFEIVESVPNA